MKLNLDRIYAENNRLRERVNALEHAVFNLGREIYFLKQRETQRKIDDYLSHYKPKNTSDNGFQH